MDLYRFITTNYGRLYNHKWLPFWFLTPIRRLFRFLEHKLLPRYFNSTYPFVPIIENRGRRIIVSLTSFPARLPYLWLVVECMLRQTCPPDLIVLYLSKKEVKSFDDIPESLRCRIGEHFEIRMVENSYRSHMKYYFAFKDFPDDFIITIDDDIWYPPTTIESLYDLSLKYPQSIIANDVMRYTYEGEKLKKYDDWEIITDFEESRDLFFLGSGAVCYPPHCMPDDLFRPDIFTDICLYADDVWLNAMAQSIHTPIVKTDFKYIVAEINNNKTPKLKFVNVDEGLNDKQINKVREYCLATKGIDPFSLSNVKFKS